MKMVQGDQDAYGAKKADEPPAVDDGFAFDKQDQEMIKKDSGQNADHKAEGRERTVSGSYDGQDKRDEDKDRQ